VDPHAEYLRALAVRTDEAAREEKLSRKTGNARLLTGIAGVVVGFFVFGEVVISPWWLLIPAAVFSVLVVFHARVDNRMQRAKRASAFYEWGLARLENRWMGRGEQGERFRGSPHVYADDLDLFGRGSLFELLCTARTHAGEDTLALWLLAAGPQVEVFARQQAVAELRERRDLREDFAILGEPVRTGVHGDSLAAWGERPLVAFAPWMRIVAATLASILAVTFSLYMAGVFRRTPFLVTLFVLLAFLLFMRSKVDQVTDGLDTPAHDLDLLATLLNRMESEHFESPLLAGILERIRIRGLTASAQISKLHRLVERLDWGRNMFFAPLAAVLLWREQLAMAIESWRGAAGPAIRNWIAAVGEFEALLALSGYSFEHPADPFPAFVERDGWFEAAGLGHPLMSEAQCVRNDVRLGDELRLLVVSGSNMSGKSTLLRSVGLNTVLAWAGAPVRAASMTVSPLAVGASIRVVDSLQDGRSRFYAEITRLREIVSLTSGKQTVLFLIDELLSGTNSHDRFIGAQAVVRGLVNRGAIGIITTHDLALAHIAEDFDGRAANVHFADTIENGALHFDYHLREGVVQKSNALELMRSVGLEV
jgi:hypothetical protein